MYDIIRYQPNAYSITVGFFFFKWSSTLRYLVFEPDGDDYDDDDDDLDRNPHTCRLGDVLLLVN